MVKNLSCVSHGSLKRFPHTFTSLNSVVEYPIGLEVKGRKRYLTCLLFG